MKSPTLRVSLLFANNMPDDTVIVYSGTVLDKVFSAGSFTNPPVTAAVLQAAIDAFQAAKWSQVNGGKLATAMKQNRREELLVHMKALALYVQTQSANNMETLLSSGFEPISTNRTRTPLPKSAIRKIGNGMSGEALVTAVATPNAKSYETRVAEVGPDGVAAPYRTAGISTSSRNILVSGLVPGTIYHFQVRAIGGLTGYAEWSDAVVQRAA